MDNTMILIVSLLVFLAIFIVAVIVVSAMYDKPSHENSQISIDREVLRTKSGQNLLGPK